MQSLQTLARTVAARRTAAILSIVAACLAAAVAFAGPTMAADQTVRVGVLQYGTVNWVLDVMAHHGFDRNEGVDVDAQPFASNQATAVALQGGKVDIIVTDWLWVSRQRAAGRHFTFVPFSSSVGAIMVPPGSPVHSIADLKGRKLGVAGGPLDKSWLLLRGLAERQAGFDPASASSVFFTAPPLLEQKAADGELDASLNFWNYCARLQAKGFRRVIDVNQIAARLGASGPVSAIGYVFDEDWADRHEATVKAFLKASADSERLMKASDAEWQRLKPLTGAKDDKTLAVLRDRFREGIPERPLSAEMKDAAKLYGVLAAVGGRDLVGPSKTMSEGTYWSVLSGGS